MIVVDASAVAAVLLVDTPSARRAAARLASEPEQSAPALLDLEVVSTIRRRLARAELTADRAERSVAHLADLPIARHPHRDLLPRIWELRDNVTPYDAAYVALAEALDAVLVTGDAGLAGAPGPRCAVEVLA